MSEDEVISSSSSSDEDEDAKELSLEVEKKFLKTLQCLKTKDPSIYDSNVKFFDKNDEATEEVDEKKVDKQKKNKKSKPFLLSDYDKLLVESGGDIKEEPDIKLSHIEEQEELKSSFKKALLDSDSDEDSDNNGLLMLKKKKKTKEAESSDEETQIKEWLIGNKDEIKDEKLKTELKPLHDIWTDPKLEEGEVFLRDYILNKKYLENDPKDDEETEEEEEVDENFDEKQEEFEHKYNFRFEDPDQDFIKRYPRTMESSMRRKESKRKLKRDQSKRNKIDKVEEKKMEMKKLKKQKREEIVKHLNSLKNITGNQSSAFKDQMMDGEFNPDEHDRIMEQVFNEEFYAGQDDEKPVFDDDLDDFQGEYDAEDGGYDAQDDQVDDTMVENDGNVEEQNGNEEYGDNFEDNGELIMDCDYDPTVKVEKKLSRSKQKRRNRKDKPEQKSLFAQAVQKPKPVFNPQDKTFMKYVDEYYGLEFEDLIGDLPCRFKYKRVVPNAYGLSIDEILGADDKELNKWCSIKKIYKQRSEHVEKNEVNVYAKRAKDENLKKKLLPSLFKTEEEGDDEEENQKILPSEEEKKEMIKKKQKKIQKVSEEYEKVKNTATPTPNENTPNKKKTKKGKGKKIENEPKEVIDENIVNEYLKETKKNINRKRKLSHSENITNNKEGEQKSGKKAKKNNEDVNPTKNIKQKEVNNKTNNNNEKSIKSEKMNGDLTQSKKEKQKEVKNKTNNIQTLKSTPNKENKKKKENDTVNKTIEIVEKKPIESNNKDNIINNTNENQTSVKSAKKKRKRMKQKEKKKLSEGTNNENGEGSKTKRKRKKKKKKANISNGEINTSSDNKKKVGSKIGDRKKLKTDMRKKFNDKKDRVNKIIKFNNKKDVQIDFTDTRLKAYGINPKKYKSKLIYGNKD